MATVMTMDDRGCDYCSDDQNMYYGHVEQVASHEDIGLLLRCPQCRWLYLDPLDGLSGASRIDSVDAARLFGFPS